MMVWVSLTVFSKAAVVLIFNGRGWEQRHRLMYVLVIRRLAAVDENTLVLRYVLHRYTVTAASVTLYQILTLLNNIEHFSKILTT